MEAGTDRLTAWERVHNICDNNTFKEINRISRYYNPIHFPGYKEKLKEAKSKTGLDEAVLTGLCRIMGNPCVLVVLDSHFMMGSMGSVAGEKICRAFELAASRKLPVVSFAASGGARMQEGLFSLFQMTKTTGAILKHNEKSLLYISVITDPTLGGVSASFASLADIILAEEGTVYGFTGRRIIQETIYKELPEEFQSAESALKNGAVDRIVTRAEMKHILGTILSLHRD